MKKNDCRRDAFPRRHAAIHVDRPSVLAAEVTSHPDCLPIISLISLFFFHAVPEAAFSARWPHRQTTLHGKHACPC
ncbi:hypothetical protein [Burkholderia catarinensis]|uniref:hypothetical protein n=1 Tax=Burkholderia catarinensis TaxID=1108140 RepID=UPI001C58CCC2|nr:hypothetical protein [Burkholderia catarinensis]